MKLATLHRKRKDACPRFVTTSVVSDNSLPYGQNYWAVDTPEKTWDFWNAYVASQPDHEPDKENVVVVLLSARLTPIGWNRVSVGTVNESSAHPREILRPVIAGAAYGFILMHNHPSGDPSPSQADEAITRRVSEAAKLMQISFLDHTVIGRPGFGRSAYFSFREAGIIA